MNLPITVAPGFNVFCSGSSIVDRIVDFSLIRRGIAFNAWREVVIPFHERLRDSRLPGGAALSVDDLRVKAAEFRDSIDTSLREQRPRILHYYALSTASWMHKIAISRINASSLVGAEVFCRVLNDFANGDCGRAPIALGAAMTIIEGYRVNYCRLIAPISEKIMRPLVALVDACLTADTSDRENKYRKLLARWKLSVPFSERIGRSGKFRMRINPVRKKIFLARHHRYDSFETRLKSAAEMLEMANLYWEREFNGQIREINTINTDEKERIKEIVSAMNGWITGYYLIADFLTTGFFSGNMNSAAKDFSITRTKRFSGILEMSSGHLHRWFEFPDPMSTPVNSSDVLDEVKWLCPDVDIERTGEIREDVNQDVLRMILMTVERSKSGENLRLVFDGEHQRLSVSPVNTNIVESLRSTIGLVHPKAEINKEGDDTIVIAL